MIYYLVKAGHPKYYTIDVFLNEVAPEAKTFITPLTYEEVFRTKRCRLGTYIFSDIERLNEFELEAAAEIWNTLERHHPNIKLLNHPLKAMRRYQLLRCLYINGLNNFNVYRLTELRCPAKFPVFIRGENDHAGSETSLIHNQEQLAREIESLITSGKTIESRIITEYCAESDEDGLYNTFSAYNIDGRIIPRHLIFSDKWMTKSFKTINDKTVEKSKIYMDKNPHAEEIMEIFSIANIDYGRIDYSIVNGKLQTYEINTNPAMASVITERDYKIGAKLAFIPMYIERMKEIDISPNRNSVVKTSFKIDPIQPFGGISFKKKYFWRK